MLAEPAMAFEYSHQNAAVRMTEVLALIAKLIGPSFAVEKIVFQTFTHVVMDATERIGNTCGEPPIFGFELIESTKEHWRCSCPNTPIASQ